MIGDTITAIATASGRGGVAVIRVSGPEAFAVAEKIAGTVPAPGRFRFATFRDSENPNSQTPQQPNILDAGLVLAFKGPHSYTGEDVVEFQCHGGSVAPRRVLEACLRAGARLARRGEFTERAFLNGRLDYDQAESVLDLIGSDESVPTVVYTSPLFQPCAETFPEHFAFVGPSIRPARSQVAKTGEKLVYISMGTVNNDMLPLYRACVQAVKGTLWQVIMSVGDQVDREELGTLPDNVAVFSRVDQIAVLQKADVFLTHCGMNSASEGLYFGVPLVMLPQTSEQSGVAARAEQLGAGLRLRKTTPDAIRAALEKAMDDPSYRENAEKIGASFRASGGAKAAADCIERRFLPEK